MTDITIPPIVLRTTSDGEGFTHGLIFGIGHTPAVAAAALLAEAQKQGEAIERARLAESQGHRRPGDARDDETRREPLRHPDPVRHYEVVDVRLASDPGADAQEARWTAYGTLRSSPAKPGGGGY
jgi:hypothetical protein